jgi:2-polyprenyl-3-methyl-5-hydroxy-6-metoxy-1,4-benzoquinol methylase
MEIGSVSDKYKEIIKLVKNKEVLDLGCADHSIKQMERRGEKWIHKIIKDNAKYVLGVDANKTSVLELKKRGYNVMVAKVDEVGFGVKHKFDLIVAGHLIEHLDNMGIFLKNCKKHLKKNGKVILVVPNAFFIKRFIEIIFRDQVYCNPDHTMWQDPRTINSFLKKNNWKINRITWINDLKWYRIVGIPMRLRKYFHFEFIVIAQPIN